MKECFRWDQIAFYRSQMHKFVVIESAIQAVLLTGAIFSLVAVRVKDPGYEEKGELCLAVVYR